MESKSDTVKELIIQLMNMNGAAYLGMEQDIASLADCSRELVRQQLIKLGYTTFYETYDFKKCKVCNKKIRKSANFCSNECMDEYWYLKRTFFYICELCGEVKQLSRVELTQRFNHGALRFCSHACRNKAMSDFHRRNHGRLNFNLQGVSA